MTPRQRNPLWFELSGVVPLAVYTWVHIGSYATVLFGYARFGVPEPGSFWAGALELVLIWLPLLLHGGYGLVLSVSRLEKDVEQRQQTLILRATGALSFAFIVGHALWLRLPLWRGERVATDALYLLASGLSSTVHGVPVAAALHLLGALCVTSHLGLGLARFLRDYGILAPRWAQNSAFLTAAALFFTAAATVVHFATGAALPGFPH
jgi:succinate dehydrogenase/fumarate reductase cytochrome b subunit